MKTEHLVKFAMLGTNNKFYEQKKLYGPVETKPLNVFQSACELNIRTNQPKKIIMMDRLIHIQSNKSVFFQSFTEKIAIKNVTHNRPYGPEN